MPYKKKSADTRRNETKVRDRARRANARATTVGDPVSTGHDVSNILDKLVIPIADWEEFVVTDSGFFNVMGEGFRDNLDNVLMERDVFSPVPVELSETQENQRQSSHFNGSVGFDGNLSKISGCFDKIDDCLTNLEPDLFLDTIDVYSMDLNDRKSVNDWNSGSSSDTIMTNPDISNKIGFLDNGSRERNLIRGSTTFVNRESFDHDYFIPIFNVDVSEQNSTNNTFSQTKSISKVKNSDESEENNSENSHCKSIKISKRLELHQRIFRYTSDNLQRLQTLRLTDPKARAEYDFFIARSSKPDCVCICCNRFFYKRYVMKNAFDCDKLYAAFSSRKEISLTSEEFRAKVFTKFPTEYICRTCNDNIIKGKIPRYAISNGLGFPDDIPEEVKTLNFTEQLLLLPYIPFVQVKPMQKYGLHPQKGAKGALIHVPVDIVFHQHLPIHRDNDVYGIVKRCIDHKTNYSEDRIRPEQMVKAMEFLAERPLYKEAGVTINRQRLLDYINEKAQLEGLILTNDDADSNATEMSNQKINEDTPEKTNLDDDEPAYDMEIREDCVKESLLMDGDNIYVMAPGQGKQPMHWHKIPHILEYVLLTTFGGQPAELAEGITLADRIKCYIDNANANLRTPFNILYMAKLYIEHQLLSSVQTELRKGVAGNITAGQIADKEFMNELFKLENALHLTKTVRLTPAYLHSAKLDCNAMIRQLGIPACFATFSPAESYDLYLLQYLAKLHKNLDLTLEECLNLSVEEKEELISKDPAIDCLFFREKVIHLKKLMANPDGPFGEHPVEDFFMRTEFQARGPPHEHCLFWMKDAPKYDKNDKASIPPVIDFINENISCANNQEENPFIAFQIHKHTHTCYKGRKGSSTCRFAFPRFPMRETNILDPLPSEEKNAITKSNLKKIRTLLEQYFKKESKDTFDDMLSSLEMTDEEYIAAVRSSIKDTSVFLQRRPIDVKVNNYHPKLLGIWQANMDLQFVLNEYSVANYILDYMTKDETEMAKNILETTKKAVDAGKTTKDVYYAVVNQLINGNMMGAHQAYYTVKQIPLVEKSRQCIFISTDSEKTRKRILKSNKDLAKLNPEDTNICKNGLLEQYAERSKFRNDDCLAVFAAKYARYTDSSGELVTRAKLRIIRYARISKHTATDAKEYQRQRLVLYYPWRNMTTDIDEKVIKDLYEENIEVIKENAKIFNVLEDFDDLIEKRQSNQKDKENDDDLDHNEESEDEQYNPFEEIMKEKEKKKEKNPSKSTGRVSTKDQEKQKGIMICVPPRINEYELDDILGKLNDQQRNIVMHIYSSLKSCDENQFILLLGPAGTGKSFTINALYQLITRHFDKIGPVDSQKVVLTASTGKAAFLIKGVTLHSAFKIGSNFTSKFDNEETNADIRLAYRDVKLIIVDEVSMVSSTLLNQLNQRLKKAFKTDKIFGGKTVLLVGDFKQLPPVQARSIFEKPGMDCRNGQFLENPLMKFCTFYELTKVERQKDDLEMIDALNEMAVGNMSDKSIDFFKQRMVSPILESTTVPSDSTRLFKSNEEVDSYNSLKIKNHPGHIVDSVAEHKFSFRAKDSKETIEKNMSLIQSVHASATNGFRNVPNILYLKIGIRYMIIVNINVSDGIFNGATGKLHHLEYDGNDLKCLWIDFESNEIGRQARVSRIDYIKQNNLPDTVVPIVRYALSKEGCDVNNIKHSVTRLQFPLVPAEALTIHKSQGQTFNSVCIHMNGTFRRELLYVACSRVRSIKNLYIVGFIFFPPKQLDETKGVGMGLLEMRQRPLKFAFETFDKSGCVISYQNVRGYRSNIGRILKDPWYFKSNVLIFSETNINDEAQIRSIDGYEIWHYSFCPKNQLAKGILIYVNNSDDLLYIRNKRVRGELAGNKYFHFELILIKLKWDNSYIITGYKSPTTPFYVFQKYMRKLVRGNVDMSDTLTLIGDFNFNCYLEKSSNFLNWIHDTTELTSVLSSDTVTTDNGSQPDIIFSNHPNISGGVYRTYISDHDVIFCQYRFEHESQDTEENSKDLQLIDNETSPNPIVSGQKRSNKVLESNVNTIVWANTSKAVVVGVSYVLTHLCSITSTLHGLLNCLDNDFVRAYLLDSDNLLLNFLESITSEKAHNAQLLIQFLLNKQIIEKPTDSNSFNKSMVGSIEDDIMENLLDFHISYISYCENCKQVINSVKNFAKNFTIEEICELEQTLKSHPKRRSHCKQPMDYTPQPFVLISTTGNYEMIKQKLKLFMVPRNIEIFGKNYSLGFLISYTSGTIGHYVTYSSKGNSFWEYDDTKNLVTEVSDQLIIYPRLLVYVEVENSSPAKMARTEIIPVELMHFRIICKNSGEIINSGTEYQFSNMCGLNSFTHGLKYLMVQHPNFRNFVQQSSVEYFRYLNALSDDVGSNLNILFNFLNGIYSTNIQGQITRRIQLFNCRQTGKNVTVNMLTTIKESLNAVLNSEGSRHTTFQRQCSNCGHVERHVQIDCNLSSNEDLGNLSTTLNTKLFVPEFECRGCRSLAMEFENTISDLVLIEPYFPRDAINNPHQQREMDIYQIPTSIVLNEEPYDLSFLIARFEGGLGHFKCYFKTAQDFVILDDLGSVNYCNDGIQTTNVEVHSLVYFKRN